ncbi:hypothetical protein Tco_1116912 [Tanacetum coccineum]
MEDGCWIGEWIWAEDGEAGIGWAMGSVGCCWCGNGSGVGGAAVGDCWATDSVGCCWCGNGSVCPIVGVVRVGFRTVGCRSKVSSKKTSHSVERFGDMKSGIEFHFGQKVSSATALQVLKRLGSIFTSVYAVVQKLKKALGWSFSSTWLTTLS